MGFKLIYYLTPQAMGGFYFLVGSIFENVEYFGKTAVFSDCGNTARADTAGWGSVGTALQILKLKRTIQT